MESSLCSLGERWEPSDCAVQILRNTFCGIKPVTPAEKTRMIQGILITQDSAHFTPLRLATEVVPTASAKDRLLRKTVVLRTRINNVLQYKPLVNCMIAYSCERPVNIRKNSFLRKRWETKNKKSSEHDPLHIQGITFPKIGSYYFDAVGRNKCKL